MLDKVRERSGQVVSAREVDGGRPAPSTAKSSDGIAALTEADADALLAASGHEGLIELLSKHGSQGNESAHGMSVARVVFYAEIPVVLVVVLVVMLGLVSLKLMRLQAKKKMEQTPRREDKEETDVVSLVCMCRCA
ncbi:hypothetical protein ERJ75_000405000 [Trypanosoma vivax]|nr:hypothetical protein ERJ75_000405000 [Trypanosoma vivax]